MNFTLIGLTVRDKRIYEALIAYPSASIRKIAEITGINRGSVFESIKDLRNAGLVTTRIIGKRQLYRAKDPEVIHEIIREKQSELRDADASLTTYIDSFHGRANDETLFHFASSYEGDEGFAAILRDVLKTCRRDNISEYRVIASQKVASYLYTNFPHFTRERAKQKLFVRVLRQGTSETDDKAVYAESKSFSSPEVDTGCYTIIYGQKVAVITINDVNQSSGVIIDNQHFANIQRMMFDASWARD